MPAPPPTSLEVYNSLVSLLSPLAPQVFELDVLPSYFPAEIHSTSSAIALPKPLLASLFLTAHHVFFSYLNASSPQRGKIQLQTLYGTSISAPAYVADDDALQAAKIILLWDPNHLTAANFRKSHLLSLSPSSSDLIQHLKAELSFLTSLLTSPLPKHTKSSTLWSHRFFLFSKFGHEILSSGLVATTLPDSSVSGPPRKETTFKNLNNNDDNDNDNEHTNAPSDNSLHLLWLHELEIIMKAGDRHPKNYYAWSYARQLLIALSTGEILPSSPARQIGKHQVDATRMSQIAATSVFQVQRWCLAHPRDISGWTFLEYLLTTGLGWEREGRAEEGMKCDRGGLEGRVKGRLGNGVRKEVDEIVRRVVKESEDFVSKFRWKGDSLVWFLNAMGPVE